MKELVKMAKRIGSFNSVNQVVRFLMNNNQIVIGINGMIISTLNGDIELVEKANRIWVK